MAKKLLFREWNARLEAIMRENDMDGNDVDKDTATNYWREGYSPAEFYREVVCSESYSVPGDRFDPRYEL